MNVTGQGRPTNPGKSAGKGKSADAGKPTDPGKSADAGKPAFVADILSQRGFKGVKPEGGKPDFAGNPRG